MFDTLRMKALEDRRVRRFDDGFDDIKFPEWWGKGDDYDEETDRHCIRGALWAHGAYDGSEPFLLDAVCCLFPDRDGGADITYFNDHPDTTHADVIAVRDHAREDLIAHISNELQQTSASLKIAGPHGTTFAEMMARYGVRAKELVAIALFAAGSIIATHFGRGGGVF
jgi:hypothetical protein